MMINIMSKRNYVTKSLDEWKIFKIYTVISRKRDQHDSARLL